MNINNTEIERKFLVERLPDGLENYKCFAIKQGYISTDPTIRLRQQDDKYILTVKGAADAAGLKRAEFELPLTKEQFAGLWAKCETGAIVKKRYIIPLDSGFTAELDIYDEKL